MAATHTPWKRKEWVGTQLDLKTADLSLSVLQELRTTTIHAHITKHWSVEVDLALHCVGGPGTQEMTGQRIIHRPHSSITRHHICKASLP